MSPTDSPNLATPTAAPDSHAPAGGPPARTRVSVAEPRRRIIPQTPREPRRVGPFTLYQWIGSSLVAALALVTMAAGVVALAQWLRGLDAVQEFLVQFHGASALPAGAPIGVPAWMGWQHFLNVFLMVLVIRSGLQIRREERPAAFWSPKWNHERKISLTIWFHQSLDLLWVINGVAFIVLLFVTGQWVKIVPISWDVFPNALSAGLQYLSLDWPTENGWVHYNALQQIAYFLTVFVAAPLAAATGVRMSGLWPQQATTLSRLFPIELARKIHFPVMLYFVAFIVTHVALVFATGALRNLNHMYAAQGSVDPDAYAGNWTGFWIFAASMIVVLAAVVVARPVFIAPIARLFGTVSSR
ncbi:cytochrome b/b6 domain-containing protein [Leucobacter sp. W1478]|uniref:cytochrome b/b6 domain-containing protein n=1 Tax=Leucobacter sp. W1478 TaxID=3439065 RepID=UPI003F2A480A